MREGPRVRRAELKLGCRGRVEGGGGWSSDRNKKATAVEGLSNSDSVGRRQREGGRDKGANIQRQD